MESSMNVHNTTPTSPTPCFTSLNSISPSPNASLPSDLGSASSSLSFATYTTSSTTSFTSPYNYHGHDGPVLPLSFTLPIGQLGSYAETEDSTTNYGSEPGGPGCEGTFTWNEYAAQWWADMVRIGVFDESEGSSASSAEASESGNGSNGDMERDGRF